MAPPLPSAARRLRGADRVVPFLASRSQASHSGNGDPSSIADGSGKWPKIACVWLTNAVANCQFAHRALFFFFIMMAMLAPSTAAIQSTIHSRSTSLPVDSTISVVGPHSIGQSDQFASFGRMHNNAVDLFLEVVQQRGGLLVGNQRHNVRVVTVGDGSSPSYVVNATATALAQVAGGPLFIVGPYGSMMSIPVSTFVKRLDLLFVANTATNPAVVQDNPLAFATFPTSRMYFSNALKAVVAEATAIDAGSRAADPRCTRGNCRAGLRLGAIQIDNAAYMQGCSIMGTFASEEGIALASVSGGTGAITISHEPTNDDISRAVSQLEAAGANVLLLCVLKHTASHALQRLEEIDFSPLAVMAYQGVYDLANHRSNYVIVPNPWHWTRPGRGSFSNITSTEFHEMYGAWTGSFPNRNAVSIFSSLCIIAEAIETADTTNTTVVADTLRRQTFREIWGDISFAPVGLGSQNDMQILATQLMDGIDHIIGPPDASTRSIHFPAPRWTYRHCIRRTVPECSGNGVCSTDGVCKCSEGFGGESCQMVHAQASTDMTGTLIAASGSLALTFCLIALGIKYTRQRRAFRQQQLRLRTTHKLPVLTLKQHRRFHLFLSHVWGSGQDQVAQMKQRLVVLMPSIQIFRDVRTREHTYTPVFSP